MRYFKKNAFWAFVSSSLLLTILAIACSDDHVLQVGSMQLASLLSGGAVVTCSTNPLVLQKGQSAVISFGNPSNEALVFSLSSSSSSLALGSISGGNSTSQAIYQAPSAIPQALDLQVSASSVGISLNQASCLIHLAADGNLGVPNNGNTQGLAGNVYAVTANTKQVPSSDALDAMTPIASIVIPNFGYPRVPYTQPIPGITLVSWYAVAFEGQLLVSTAGTYCFQMMSDDGSATFLDGQMIIDLSTHPTLTKNSSAIPLTSGWHQIRVNFEQWDGPNIGLMLSWAPCNSTGKTTNPFVVIPPANYQQASQ